MNIMSLKKYFTQGSRPAALLLFLVLLISLMIFDLPDRYLHLWFLDVGQGDSILIKTPTRHYFLIDGGPDDSVVTRLSEEMPFWQKKIDAVFLTHSHSDHITGLIAVLERYQVDRLFINPDEAQGPEWEALMKVVLVKGIMIHHFWQSDSLVDKDFKMNGIWPLAWDPKVSSSAAKDANQISLVLLLEYKNFRALLSGDSEEGPENPTLEFYDWSKVDLVKVAHHASQGALSQAALEKLDPKVGVISVGKDNKLHLPSQETLDLLVKKGVVLWRTDEKGTVEVVSDGQGWLIR